MKSHPLLSVASFILCLSVSGAPSVLAANVTVWDAVGGRTIGLSDVSESAWFGAHVQQVSKAGIMQGYRDSRGWLTGKFGPANAVTRAEFLKMVAVMMVNRYDFDRSVIPTGNRWYANYLAVVEAKDPQLSEVMPTDDASLSQPILRHEAAGLLHLSLGNYPKNGITADMWSQYQLFSDVTKDSLNAYAIAELKFYGVLSGDGTTGKFSPFRTLNRAEAAKMLVVTASAYQTPLGPDSESATGNVSVFTEDDALLLATTPIGVTFDELKKRFPDIGPLTSELWGNGDMEVKSEAMVFGERMRGEFNFHNQSLITHGFTVQERFSKEEAEQLLQKLSKIFSDSFGTPTIQEDALDEGGTSVSYSWSTSPVPFSLQMSGPYYDGFEVGWGAQ